MPEFMPDQTTDDVVKAWFDGEHTMYDAVLDTPEIAWEAILKILKGGLTPEQLANLAAGPLESLLGYHGTQFIDRVENEARRNPSFNYLLGGVWKGGMSKDIWERVKKARLHVW